MKKLSFLLCLFFLSLTSCDLLTPEFIIPLEEGDQCSDGVDNDGSGAFDCQEPTCVFEAFCLCGNGVIDVGEQCDDGNKLDNDGCANDCKTERCGDGITQSSEACDDGNTISGDGCSSVCESEACGDGTVQPELSEQCDDGNNLSNDGCDASCVLESCGDGVIQDGISEQCDDSNENNNDGCSSTCQLEICGDGIQQSNEGCDDGNEISNDGCHSDCILEFCGDGIVQDGIGEECDDSNAVSGDGCSAACKVEFCGDGTTQPGEQCDDGNTSPNDGCDAQCRNEFCGDGIQQASLSEGCDDGNTTNGDGCNASCLSEFCGDGTKQPSEACDDGNQNNNDGCSAQCAIESCGDGFLQTSEQCDDGNNISFDGCNAQCRIEVCGDGVLHSGEQCDDGNKLAGDGCSAQCVIEFCGDGLPQAALGEQCDDGNNLANDGCDGVCHLERCGDGVLQSGEQCDDTNNTNNDGCSAQCVVEFCGDGIKQTSEQCDDGNNLLEDGCNAACKIEKCGDNVLQTGLGEFCDDGNTKNNDGCNAQCAIEFCGDAVLQTGLGEGCDDGNTIAGDGCNAQCIGESCGDGILQPNEGCDDGNQNNNDGCSKVCVVERCGDGVVQTGEGCDDGNNISGDGCNAQCVAEFCGDGILQNGNGESCDDGNTTDEDGCSADCVLEFCGDLVVQAGIGEQCEDGNQNNIDACHNNCKTNVPPTLDVDTFTTAEDVALVTNKATLLQNDKANDGDTLTLVAVQNAQNGSVVLSGDQIVFQPNANFNGTASFQYRVTDGFFTVTGNVQITVTAVNDAPIAVDDARSTNEDVVLTVSKASLLANDTDIDAGTVLQLTAVSNAVNGTAVISGQDVVFTPNTNFNGTAKFDYTVSDGTLTDLGTVTVTVTAVNDAPVAVDDTASTNEDVALTIAKTTLLANDTDVDAGTVLQLTAVSNAVNGTAVISGQDVVFTPNLNFNGTAKFDYTVSDGTLADLGTVTVTVNAVNDAPVADGQSIAVTEDTAASIVLTASDLEGDSLTFELVSTPTNGVLSGAAPNLVYTPNLNFNGIDAFVFRANDGVANSNTATINLAVSAVNDAPVANPDVVQGVQNQSVVVNNDTLLLNDSDVDGDTIRIVNVFNAQNGTVVGDEVAVTFTPNPGFVGTATAEYTISDGQLTATTTVSFEISVNATCGNGQIEGAELCDDANVLDGDGCSSLCATEVGFVCEGVPSVCKTVCGDGVVSFDEECDDGNVRDDDGCSAQCVIEFCGDGIVQPNLGEQCEQLGGLRIDLLTTANCLATEHNNITGDDRGGIAVSKSRVFYTGDNATGSFDLNSLAAESTGQRFDALSSDLATGRVYTLATGDTPLGQGGTVTSLLEIDGVTGQILPESRIDLSSAFDLIVEGDVGIFAGVGSIFIHDGSQVIQINTTNGVVTFRGPMPNIPHQGCENWAYWGVAEEFDGKLFLDAISNSAVIRNLVPSGEQEIFAAFDNLSDMCSFTVSPQTQRWYFHHEGTSQIRSGDETIGFCDAKILLQNPGASTSCDQNCQRIPICGDGIVQNDGSSVCGKVDEGGTLDLICPAGKLITNIDFASYGDSTGDCGNLVTGACDALNSVDTVAGICLGQNSCRIDANNDVFGDPCGGIFKNLLVSVTCGQQEECDDGNVRDGDGCSGICVREFCGDGIVQESLGESCDDGNNKSLDGCSPECQFETFQSIPPTEITGGLSGCTLDTPESGRRIARDTANTLYAGLLCNEGFFVSRSISLGLGFLSPVRVPFTDIRQVAIQGGPANVAYAVAITNNNDLLFSRTTDRGHFWQPAQKIGSSAGNLLSLASRGDQILVAADGEGGPQLLVNQDRGVGGFVNVRPSLPAKFYDVLFDAIGFVYLASDTPQFHIIRSTNGGLSFEPELSPPGEAGVTDWTSSDNAIFVLGRGDSIARRIPTQDLSSAQEIFGFASSGVTGHSLSADNLGHLYAGIVTNGVVELDYAAAGESIVQENRQVEQGDGVSVLALPNREGAALLHSRNGQIFFSLHDIPCGNGLLEPQFGEQCDDSNNRDRDGCSRFCQVENIFCGNGLIEEGEQCDDSNRNDGDGCNSLCFIEQFGFCGDGIVDAGELCDQGGLTGNGCELDCQVLSILRCGNGTIDAGEECDDGNRQERDGCSPVCLIEGAFCHDIGFTGPVQVSAGLAGGNFPNGCPTGATQFCDDKPIRSDNREQAFFACETCMGVGRCFDESADSAGPAFGPSLPGQFRSGDPYWGFVVTGFSNSGAGRVFPISFSFDTIGTWAPFAFCGNSTIDPGEDCDDGNVNNDDSCPSTCSLSVLRNGSFETGDFTDWTLLETGNVDPLAGIWTILQTNTLVDRSLQLFDFFDQVSGTTSTPNAFTVFATGGVFAAVQVQNGAQNHRMFQDVTIPTGVTLLTWDMSYRNEAGGFDPGGQFIAINVRNPADDSILATIFQTTEGVDPQIVETPQLFSADLSPFAGQFVRIDIEMQVQNFFFPAVFDNFVLQ